MATTVYDDSAFLAELWNQEAEIDGLSGPQFLVQTLEHDFAVKGAASVHVTMVESFSANDMVNNEVVDQAGSETDIEVALNKHKHVSTVIKDISVLQSPTGAAARMKRTAGFSKALYKQIDSDFVTALAAISPSAGHTVSNSTAADWIDLAADGHTVGEVVAALEALALRARTVLSRADIDDDKRYYMVCPELEELVLKSEKYTSSQQVGEANLVRGQFGSWYGAPVIKRNDAGFREYVAIDGEVAAHTILTCYLYHSSIMAAGLQKHPTIQGSYELKALGYRVVADTVYGLKEARTDSLAKIQYYFAGDPFNLA